MNPKRPGEVNQHFNRGYLCLSLAGNKHYIHRLVCEAFYGLIEKDIEVNHLNGNKSDNNLDNLELVTRSENIKHAYANNLAKGKPGETNSQSKLSNEDYYQIISMIMSGFSNQDISNKYGLHSRYISLIRGKKRLITIWKQWEHDNSKANLIPVSGDKSKFNYTQKLEIINAISTLSNIEIARQFNIEASMVSRIRSKLVWKDVWSIYEEKEQRPVVRRTLQVNNGSGNGEHPIKDGDMVSTSWV